MIPGRECSDILFDLPGGRVNTLLFGRFGLGGGSGGGGFFFLALGLGLASELAWCGGDGRRRRVRPEPAAWPLPVVRLRQKRGRVLRKPKWITAGFHFP